MSALKAPFPWFGGKSRAAYLVWEAFGEVANYVEPFAGSLAVLLGRPTPPRVETVNDLDVYVANFWRAMQACPSEVAGWADSPVNEADLHARHRWLVNGPEEASLLRRAATRAIEALNTGDTEAALTGLRGAIDYTTRPLGPAFRKKVREDESFFDAQVAGWWVWGICQWIGSGWCVNPEWQGRAHPGNGLRGVHSRRVRDHSRDSEYAKRPRLGKGGQGVHRTTVDDAVLWQQKPDLSGSRGAAGRGVHGSGQRAGVHEWFGLLAERLRNVRVCCGDWQRVVTPSATTQIGVTGVLLDPPYAHDAGRDPGIYSEESVDVAHRVREWALANGDDPNLRIALCGYDGEHEMPDTWRCVAWEASGGYAAARGNKENAKRERIWFSPHCLRPDRLQQASLLGLLEGQP